MLSLDTNKLILCREYALLGKYEQSLLFFDGAISTLNQYHPFAYFLCELEVCSRTKDLQRYLKTVRDPDEKGKWEKVKDALLREIQVIKDLSAEASLFKQPQQPVWIILLSYTHFYILVGEANHTKVCAQQE